MKKEPKGIMRGINDELAKAFKECELYKLYEKNKDELFIGVRNNYLNLYYNCDSIAKVKYIQPKGEKGKRIVCEIDKYYIGGDNSADKRREPKEICSKYDDIKTKSDNKEKDNSEKKAQSKLVISNNNNEKSNWFCIDVEYIKQFNSNEEKENANFNGRFDIIAISKEQPHRVALIELKYGSGAIGGKSGIYKHIKDFIKFNCEGFFESHLKQEIVGIIKSQKALGIPVPFDISDKDKFAGPDFFVITLNNNPEKVKGSTPKQTMAGYLFNDKDKKDRRWDCKRYSKHIIENDFKIDVTQKDSTPHVTFLFSTATHENGGIEKIIDILDEINYKEPV